MQLVKALLSSKKFIVMFAGALAWVGAKFGLGLTADEMLEPMLLIASYIVGQGLSDAGKEAKRLSLEAAKDDVGAS